MLFSWVLGTVKKILKSLNKYTNIPRSRQTDRQTELTDRVNCRFGLCPAIASIHTIQAGEEIFVRYGYDLDFCPDWYLLAWEQGEKISSISLVTLSLVRELSHPGLHEGGV